jgi:tripartite-type tricarboxylate transporter receptor subunit TctC
MRQDLRACLGRAVALIALALVPGLALAQSYPAKPVRFIIPFPPGGTTDIVGRLVADKMGQFLGQPVVVENRGGGGGAIGAEAVAKATPDGYTIGMATVSTHAVNPACNPKLSYDPIKDFQFVTNFVAVPNVLATSTTRMPVKDMSEFLKQVRASPGKTSYASSGTCGIGHMMGEIFKVTTGTFILHIPYRGAGPALNDVVGGQLEMIFDNLPSSLPHIQAGKLRPLAVAAPKRVDVLPNVPTFAELGMLPVNDRVWYGLVVPAKTPPDVIAKLQDAAVKALNDRGVREKLKLQGAEPVGNSPAEFRGQVEAELAKMRSLVKRQGIQLEQ